MKPARLLLFLGLGIAGCRPALAQDAQPWIGAPDCRLAAVHPAPAGPPAWKGGCKGGFADGKGVLEWRDGAGKPYRLEASLAAGGVQGEGKLRFPDGTVYIGTLTNAIPDGRGYFRDPDGTQYEGDVRMGERTGVGEALYPNGDDYKGQWKKGKRDGTGVLAYMLGGRYEGGWKDDEESGQGKLVYAGTEGRAVAVVDGKVPDQAAAAASKERYVLKEDVPHTGTLLRRDAAREIPVPPNRGYKQLSAQQQATVRRWYPALAPGDEPPYPLNGPGQFYMTMQRIVSATRQEGSIYVYVRVGKDGKLVNVTAIGLDNPEVRKAAATAAGLIAYKPALCDGQPCEMVYPYHLALTMEN